MENKMKWAGVLISGMLAMVILNGCGKTKQEAAVSLDEARLNISSAKKTGADIHAYSYLKTAESALQSAEQSFKKGDYANAKKDAFKASEIAQTAKSETAKKLAEEKQAETAKKLAGKKQAKPSKKTSKRK